MTSTSDVASAPASPGAAAGRIAFNAEHAVSMAKDGPVILVRIETSPEDIHGMARAAGIVTAWGGIASHAAVVARGWGIAAVVGAREIEVRRDGIGVNGRTVPVGEVLTIDGGTGEVFRGAVEAATEAVLEAGILIDWARDLGIAIGAQASTAAPLPPRPEPSGEGVMTSADDAAVPVDAGECLRLIGLKGFATVDGLAEALGCPTSAAMAAVDELIAVGDVSESAGALRLTDAGTARHHALLAAGQDELGRERIDSWFDPFLELDRRTKVTVTAWQLREAASGSGPVVNDHGDAAYDALVLERLVALAEAVDEWLGTLEVSAPRFGAYRRRLRGAAQRAVAGDQRYVASPRVDSYHGIWFELHEDLILLAGRTRAAEVAAGRA